MADCRKLAVDWASFGQAIRAQAVIDAKNITAIQHELGLSHARMVNAAQGKPVGTEIFLTLCHWMQQDPMHYTRPLQDCPACEGEGTVEHPHLKGSYKGSHSETPDDPAIVECEVCGGTGQQEIEE